MVLARGPVQLPAAHDVDVEMVDRLSTVLAIVDHKSVAVSKSLLLGHLLGYQEKVSQELSVSLLRILDHGDPLAGDHQEVDRSLGADVIEGHALVILMDKLGWDGAVKDLVKDGGALRPTGLGLLSLITHV